jgi:ABC-type phosphate transport system substrate-binding protein
MTIPTTRVSTRRIGAALTAVLASGVLLAGQQSAHADIAPQEKDVLAVGSDVQQNAFNFLADGYHGLPGYNTAGNKWRFFSLDSSGDDNGRSSYLQNSNTVFNPTTILRAGHDNITRPSGGSGGLGALIGNSDDTGKLIDVARSPNRPTTQQQTDSVSSGTGPLNSVQVGTDRDLIAVSSDSWLPETISAEDVLKIYEGTITKVGQLTGYSGTHGDEDLHPLYLPTSAGMLKIFTNYLTKIKNDGGNAEAFKVGSGIGAASNQVQQNDPTVITSLPDATRKTALVPFPLGRYKLLQANYYAAGPSATGPYSSTVFTRSSVDATNLKLLDATGTGEHTGAQAFGVDFAYNAIFRDSDLTSEEPWQPGSTLNWVQALFYNPGDGPEPFVKTQAGQDLLRAAGITPDYHVYLADN